MRKTITFASSLMVATLMAGTLLSSASCIPSTAQSSLYTIADSSGDWGYPTPYACYPRGPGYVRMQLIFETLVWKDDSEFIPQLAKDWEYIEEEAAYLFRLRDDVYWHDGEKFTAEDVVFTIEYTQTHPNPFVSLAGPSEVTRVEALDDYSVKLYLAQPYAPFLQDVAGTLPIIPHHIWAGVDRPEQFTSPKVVIGTGPYMLADYSKGHGTYLYKAYDGYYLGKPRVDEIRFVKISAEVIPAALQRGEVDAGEIPPEVVSRMEEAGLTVITAPVAWNAKMMINHKKEPLSSTEFRQALAYSIDRRSLVEITQRGHAIAGSPGMMPPTSDWYNPDAPQYEFNPAQARELLKGLGYNLEDGYLTRGGETLELELITTAQFKEVGGVIKNQLEEVGIKIDFRLLEAKTVDAKVQGWDFELAVCGHGGLYEPSILKRVIMDEGFNSARYTSNETLNQLLEAQLGEMNPQKRRDLIFHIQEVYAADLPALTLYYPESYWAHDGTLKLFYTKDGIGNGIPIPLNKMAFVE